MRWFVLSFMTFVWVALCTDAHAQSYLDKKDADAIGIIERSLAKIDRNPQLFDGTAIPPGVDLGSVKGLHDQLDLHLKAARSGFFELTAKRAAMPDARKLRVKFDDLERYLAALRPALSRAQADAESSQRQQKVDHQRAVEIAAKVCKEFRAELRKSDDDYRRMGVLTNLVDGHNVFWQTAEDGAKFKAALARTAEVCKRMPTAGASCALASNVVPLDARYCETATKGIELLQAGVKNLIAHHVKHSGPTQIIKDFDRFKGYLDVDGVVTWKAYFSGAKLKEGMAKRIAPMLAQVNLTAADGDVLFDALATELAQLEAKARETAPTWELPGSACSGPGCAQAKKFVQQWYRGAALKRFLHTKPGWKILTNEYGNPTYRERYGFALVQVKGDPFCQLRMWTLSEQYAGGGKYTAARDVHLHSVRWQTCK